MGVACELPPYSSATFNSSNSRQASQFRHDTTHGADKCVTVDVLACPLAIHQDPLQRSECCGDAAVQKSYVARAHHLGFLALLVPAHKEQSVFVCPYTALRATRSSVCSGRTVRPIATSACRRPSRPSMRTSSAEKKSAGQPGGGSAEVIGDRAEPVRIQSSWSAVWGKLFADKAHDTQLEGWRRSGRWRASRLPERMQRKGPARRG